MMRPADLISPAYLDLQRELHGRPQGYGGKGKKWAETVVALVRSYDAISVLDYGCGRGSLKPRLQDFDEMRPVRISEYDPAIRGKDGPPDFADLVVVTDVLEHIEPDRLSKVLAHIHGLTRKAAFLVVALDEANKIMLDGRNAHLILESPAWWTGVVTEAGFRLESMDDVPFPVHYTPAKRSKRWIALAVPESGSRPC